MSYPFSLWLEGFAWTFVLELPIYALFLRPYILPFWTAFLWIFSLNLSTHPAFWYLFPRFEPRWLWLLTAETWVFLTEGFLLAGLLACFPPRLAFQKALPLALLAAFFANLFSTLVGLWII